jgi:hypothetical protein
VALSSRVWCFIAGALPFFALGFFALVHRSPRSKWETLLIPVPFAVAGSMAMGLFMARFGRFRGSHGAGNGER